MFSTLFRDVVNPVRLISRLNLNPKQQHDATEFFKLFVEDIRDSFALQSNENIRDETKLMMEGCIQKVYNIYNS